MPPHVLLPLNSWVVIHSANDHGVGLEPRTSDLKDYRHAPAVIRRSAETASELAQQYLARWQIELNFRAFKGLKLKFTASGNVG